MTFVGTLRRLLSRPPSYKRVGASEHRNGAPNETAHGSRRRLSDPPHRESDDDDDDDDSDPYVEDDELAHGPFVYASFVMIGLAMLLRMSTCLHV
jgi:hypothetical protein